jgi:hypothetical protein
MGADGDVLSAFRIASICDKIGENLKVKDFLNGA